jgi:hypothetical protein
VKFGADLRFALAFGANHSKVARIAADFDGMASDIRTMILYGNPESKGINGDHSWRHMNDRRQA